MLASPISSPFPGSLDHPPGVPIPVVLVVGVRYLPSPILPLRRPSSPLVVPGSRAPPWSPCTQPPSGVGGLPRSPLRTDRLPPRHRLFPLPPPGCTGSVSPSCGGGTSTYPPTLSVPYPFSSSLVGESTPPCHSSGRGVRPSPPIFPVYWAGHSLGIGRQPGRMIRVHQSPKGFSTRPPSGVIHPPPAGPLPLPWRWKIRRRACLMRPPCAGLRQRPLRLRAPLLMLPAAAPSACYCCHYPWRPGAAPCRRRRCCL